MAKALGQGTPTLTAVARDRVCALNRSQTADHRASQKSWHAACQRGFTLIEIMIALVIIAIVMAIALPGLKHTFTANDGASMNSGASRIWSAAMSYRMDHQGEFPTAAMFAARGAALKNPAEQRYLEQWPSSPRDNVPMKVTSSGAASPPQKAGDDKLLYHSSGNHLTGWMAAYGPTGVMVFQRGAGTGSTPPEPIG